MTIHTFTVVATPGCPHAPESGRAAVEHEGKAFPVQETGQPEDTHRPDLVTVGERYY